MQDKLEQILVGELNNLGAKYVDMGNIWSNEYLVHVRSVLRNEGLYKAGYDFELGNNESAGAIDIDNLFVD